MDDGEHDLLRRATSDESEAVANLWLRSRKDSFPSNPAGIHDDDDVRNYFATVVLPEQEVWVLERDRAIVALMTLSEGWVEHLHVEPGLTDRGLGSRLIEHAKQRQPAGLDLWTFQSNTGARRFYEHHGFVAVEMTDGDNEEHAPDVRFRWRAPS